MPKNQSKAEQDAEIRTIQAELEDHKSSDWVRRIYTAEGLPLRNLLTVDEYADLCRSMGKDEVDGMVVKGVVEENRA